MKYIVAFFLLLSINGFSQKGAIPFEEVFRIDGLPQNGVLLDRGWKWRAGDNPEWAKPELDERNWEPIKPFLDIRDLPQIRQAEIGWFRIKLKIDSSLLNKSLSFIISQVGASEVYLDGKLIYRLGVVAKLPSQEQTLLRNGEVYTWEFNGQLYHQLAIRYSFTKSNFYHNFSGGGNPCMALVINYTNQAQAYNLFSRVISIGIVFILIAIHLLLGTTFLFFYFSFKTQKSYLFYGLYAFGQFISYILYSLPIIPNSISFNAVSVLLAHVFTISGVMLSSIGTYMLYFRTKGWFFYGLLGYAILTVPLMLSFYQYAWIISVVFYLVFNVDQLRLHWYGMKIRQSGARILFINCILFYIFDILHIIFRSSGRYDLSFVFNFVGLFVVSAGFCFFLAGEFARTAHNLRKRVVEVEQLSAEKQSILLTQNEILEKQVEIRTAELKASQNQLIQKEKLASLGELTAGIAHEIQNPLNFVNNFSELSIDLAKELKEEIEKVQMTDSDKEYIGEIIGDLNSNQEKINLHGKRASSIVKGMLEHSRASTGKKELTDINALADEYLRLSYHGLRAKDSTFTADFKTDFEVNLPKIEVVPQDMGRVLLNLFNNAFYAVNVSRTGSPCVQVSTRKLADSIEIRVQDNGIGMSEATKAKIFQPFFTTKPTGEGTGLGLSLAYDIVTKIHGGTIEVESKEGEGTRFIIKIPIQT